MVYIAMKKSVEVIYFIGYSETNPVMLSRTTMRATNTENEIILLGTYALTCIVKNGATIGKW